MRPLKLRFSVADRDEVLILAVLHGAQDRSGRYDNLAPDAPWADEG